MFKEQQKQGKGHIIGCNLGQQHGSARNTTVVQTYRGEEDGHTKGIDQAGDREHGKVTQGKLIFDTG